MLQCSCSISLAKELKKGCCRARLRASVFTVISSLSLPLCCGHMPVWYQHMVGNTLLPMRLFICVPVYLSSLSLRREPPPPPPPPLTVLCSLGPSVVRSILSIYLLYLLLLFCVLAAQTERERVSMLSSTLVYLPGHLIPFSSQLLKMSHLRSEEYCFRKLGVVLRDLPAPREDISPRVSPTFHRRTRLLIHKDATVTFCYWQHKLKAELIDGLRRRSQTKHDIHTSSESQAKTERREKK